MVRAIGRSRWHGVAAVVCERSAMIFTRHVTVLYRDHRMLSVINWMPVLIRRWRSCMWMSARVGVISVLQFCNLRTPISRTQTRTPSHQYGLQMQGTDRMHSLASSWDHLLVSHTAVAAFQQLLYPWDSCNIFNTDVYRTVTRSRAMPTVADLTQNWPTQPLTTCPRACLKHSLTPPPKWETILPARPVEILLISQQVNSGNFWTCTTLLLYRKMINP